MSSALKLDDIVYKSLYELEPREDALVEDDHIDRIEAIIRERGCFTPLVIDSDGALRTGHARYEAFKRVAGDLDEEIAEHEENGNEDVVELLSNLNDGHVLTYTIQGEFDE